MTTNNVIAVVAADTHLAPCAWTSRPSIHGDSYFALQQIIDTCIKFKVPLILAGDVFDKTRPDSLTISHARQAIQRMQLLGLPIYFIQGQHERDVNCPWLNSISDWPIHIHKREHILFANSENSISLYGIDWTPANRIANEIENIPANANIVIMHQVWKEFMGSKCANTECSFDQLPDNYKLFITGDYHVCEKRYLDKSVVASPGSTCMQSIDEQGRKFIYLLRYRKESSLPVYTERALLETRAKHTCHIDSDEDFAQFCQTFNRSLKTEFQNLPENIRKPLLQVIYSIKIPELHLRITKLLDDKYHLFFTDRIPRKTDFIEDFETFKFEILNRNSTKLALGKLLNETSLSYNHLVTLMNSPSPKEQLDEFYKAFVKERQ